MLTPFTLPPRLLLRALDDLHAIAEAARMLPDVERRLTERVAALDATAQEVLALGERVETLMGEVAAVGREVVGSLGTIEAVQTSARTLAQTVEPLQGVSDRLGRIVDRLPGARRPD